LLDIDYLVSGILSVVTISGRDGSDDPDVEMASSVDVHTMEFSEDPATTTTGAGGIGGVIS